MDRYLIKLIVCLFCSLLLYSCGNAKNVTSAQHLESSGVVNLPVSENGTYILKKTVDLGGKKCIIAKGVTIKAQGGVIKNGTIVGNNTKITGSKAVFDNVTVQGSWNVPNISTAMFKDLSYVNSLKDMLALTDNSIHNVVTIEKGEYKVDVSREGGYELLIGDNTECIIDGTISLVPNAWQGCRVVYVKGKNVVLRGSGKLVGDKFTHKGTKGEWGMGIYVSASDNVTVTGLKVENCWGDCIYIGNDSKNIIVSDCYFNHGRRQGVSVSSSSHVVVRNCYIENIGGTTPEYGLDVEPDKNQTIDDVLIENVTVHNSKGGFICWGGAPNAHLGKLVVKDCKVTGTCEKYPYFWSNVDSIEMTNCKSESGKIGLEKIGNLKTDSNSVAGKTGDRIYKKLK